MHDDSTAADRPAVLEPVAGPATADLHRAADQSGTRTWRVRVSAELDQQARRAAAARGVTLSAFVREATTWYLHEQTDPR